MMLRSKTAPVAGKLPAANTCKSQITSQSPLACLLTTPEPTRLASGTGPIPKLAPYIWCNFGLGGGWMLVGGIGPGAGGGVASARSLAQSRARHRLDSISLLLHAHVDDVRRSRRGEVDHGSRGADCPRRKG